MFDVVVYFIISYIALINIYFIIAWIIRKLGLFRRRNTAETARYALGLMLCVLLTPVVPYIAIYLQTIAFKKFFYQNTKTYLHTLNTSDVIYDLKVMSITPWHARIYYVTRCTGIDVTQCSDADSSADKCKRMQGKDGEEVDFYKEKTHWVVKPGSGGVLWTDCGNADDSPIPPFDDH